MTAPMPSYTISARVRGVWKKLSDWYGADVVAKHHGAIPPREWCEVIDDIPSKEAMARILAEVRAKHVTFPPRFPEFEVIATKLGRAIDPNAPSMQERLKDFVLRTKSLTRDQQWRPWTYLYTGNVRSGENSAVTGVVVPADGEHPGYRVMVADMQISST